MFPSGGPMGMMPFPMQGSSQNEQQMMAMWNHLLLNQQMHQQQIAQILQF